MSSYYQDTEKLESIGGTFEGNDDTAGDNYKEGNEDLLRYKEVFNSLTDRYDFNVGEGYAVVEVAITYDAQSAIVICRNEQLEDDKDEFLVKSYSLTNAESREEEWAIVLTGIFVKISEVQQSDDAQLLGLAYQDNGSFFCKVVTRVSKSLMRQDELHTFKPGEVICDINIQQKFQLDYSSKPIHGIYNPLITCCFLPNDKLFVAAYHRISSVQCHLIYDVENDKVDGLIATQEFPQRSQRNFPIKSFYSHKYKECYTFYRQGLVFTVDLSPEGKNSHSYDFMLGKDQQLSNELGPMYLIYD